jgi:hypothetical protein
VPSPAKGVTLPNMKSLSIFVLGVIAGAALLLGAERLHLGRLFVSKEHRMEIAVAGNWQGTVSVQGYDVDMALAVKSNGQTLSGVITSSRVGAIPCDDVHIDPTGAVAFTAHVADKSATFNGKLNQDLHTMSGSLTGDTIQGSWSLTKKS